MATVLRDGTTEEQRSLVRFLWANGLNVKDIHTEIFLVYGGKFLSRKAVHKLVEKSGEIFADDEVFEKEVRKWLRQQSKYFRAEGSDAVVNRWDKCINIEDMSRNK
jgi:hypothetical protein